MKIAIISDVHGNLEALKAVINDTKNKGVEKIFCLGDTIAKGPHSKECIELVKQKCDVVVRGNCDRHFSEPLSEIASKSEYERNRWEKIHGMLSEEEREYLSNLPYSYEFYLSGSLVRIFHSSPEADNKVLISQDSIEDKYKMFLPSDRTISDKIAEHVGRGITGIYAKGMYTNDEKMMLWCVASRNEAMRIKQMSKKVDPYSFVVISNAREAYGMGFKKE